MTVTEEAGALKATYAWVSPIKCSSGRGAWKVFRLMQRRYHGLRERLASESFPLGTLDEAINEKPIGVIKFLMTDLGVMASIITDFGSDDEQSSF